MSDRQAFIDAIIEDPANDLRRLIFADWLDDHAEADRGEFIRLQCELKRLRQSPPCGGHENGGCCWSMDCPICPLHRREQELFIEFNREWFGDAALALDSEDESGMTPGGPLLRIGRGFVAEVRCGWRWWQEGNGTLLCRANPVDRVTFVDLEPATHRADVSEPDRYPPDRPFWCSRNPDAFTRRQRHWVPLCIFERLMPTPELQPKDFPPGIAAYYSDAASANDDLSAAWIAEARGIAHPPSRGVAATTS